jgi:nitrogen fixation protein FixH
MRALLPRWLLKDSRWIPACFVLFFVSFVAADILLVTIALRSSTGPAEARSYAKGLDFNRRIEEARAQQALGWTARIDLTKPDGLAREVVVELRDAAARPLDGAEVELVLRRPTHAGFDRELSLQRAAPGTYSAEVVFPLAGLWRIEARATRAGDRFVAAERVVVQP